MRILAAALIAVIAAASASTARADPAPVLLQAEGRSVRTDCGGSGVRIEGNHNTVVLLGTCLGLRLNGVGNEVTVELRDGAPVHIEGSANRVIYRTKAGSPLVTALGPGNLVRAETVSATFKEPPSPPPTGPLAAGLRLDLVGNDQHRLADCQDRDVAIRGMRSSYVLRGSCRSITVVGDLDTIQAELAPGARLAITGSGTTVSWATAGAGGPVESIHGQGSRVQRTDMIGGRVVR